MQRQKLSAFLLDAVHSPDLLCVSDERLRTLVLRLPSGMSWRYYLGEPFVPIYLTARELQVFAHAALGRTMRRTGELMGLSARTIEFYLLNMKRKLCCRSKQALVVKLMHCELMRRLCACIEASESLPS